MKRFRILVPLFVGVAVYSLLGIFWGPRGLRAMSELEGQKTKLAANIDTLSALNTDLQSRLDCLSADPDTISVYAHELGLISDGEHLIKLAGFSGGIDRKMVTGTALIIKKSPYVPEWVCKVLGIVTGIIACALIAFLFPEKKDDTRKKLFRLG